MTDAASPPQEPPSEPPSEPTSAPGPVPAPIAAAPGPPSAAVSDERQMALIIYILYLVSFACGVTAIVGVVLAYVNREGAPEWLRSHYTFQIHTFWIGLLYMVVACATLIVLVGFALVPAAVLWFIIRCALGLSRLLRNEAYPTPQSWTI